MLAPLALTAPEITTLEAAAAQGPHPRMRRRAQAVLGHHRGVPMNQLATLYDVGRNAISRWLTRWQQVGLVGLYEGARSGRPPKLVPAAKKKLPIGLVRPPSNSAISCRACAKSVVFRCM